MNVMTARKIEVAPGVSVATRNPVALWLLAFITLGIGAVVWTYAANRELRDFAHATGRPFHGSPALAAVLAGLWPFALIPALIPVWTTSSRARGAQQWTDSSGARVHPALAVLAFFVLFLHVWYVQRALNDTWLAAERTAKGR